MKSNAQKAKDQQPPPFDFARHELDQAQLALKTIAAFEAPLHWSPGQTVDWLQHIAASALERGSHKGGIRGRKVAPSDFDSKVGQTDDDEQIVLLGGDYEVTEI